MGVPKQTAASIEVPADPRLAWRALTTVARGTDQSTAVWHFEHADVALDSTSPGEAARGTGSWHGIVYRVSAHLVPRGARETLVVLTADPESEPLGIRGTGRVWASHRQARRDLEAMAEALGVQVAEWTSTPGTA
ncbi:hypothetical protein [Cellulomonas sp.]|uniref:hypothetical protein n=1 Tax=Cellulomonas sp. TaxID=40001 RepID=UPI003BAD3164